MAAAVRRRFIPYDLRDYTDIAIVYYMVYRISTTEASTTMQLGTQWPWMTRFEICDEFGFALIDKMLTCGMSF